MNRSLFLAAAPIPAWRKRLTRSLASAVLASMAMLATTQVSTALPAPRYALFDLGTLGGPQTYLNLPGFPITNQGFVLGTSDTTIPDTDYPNFNPFMIGFPDPYVAQAIEWQNGHLINLGALPGNNSSAVFQVNSNGVGTGMSETAINDPYTGWPADHAVIFMNGGVVDLGTLPGGFESQACCITDRGIVAGFASNGTPDTVSIFGWGTQSRSFIWQNGVMHDIGTLGGPDAVMTTMNSRGQVDGQSYTSATPNASTGIPTQDPFLWQSGTMRDLGNFGGTVSFANWLSNAGEVAGQSNLPGDQSGHPFLWDGRRMVDLGTLGGRNGSANAVNDAGVVVGSADLPTPHVHYAFLWKNGSMTDLLPSQGALCSNGNFVNSRAQAVGNSTDCRGNALAAMLWENGSAFDLNTLVTPSALHLTSAEYITDRGEIFAEGLLPNGMQRLAVLIPAGLAASAGLSNVADSQPGSSAQSATGVPSRLLDRRDLVGPAQDRLASAYRVRFP